ncbi:YaiI/YqxD family protein [Legionella longbeachae]|uniref:UPF0178 protein LLO_2225 n=1 Tax=Legionella longbeachae serogroup 1 (strain NSW150) TaxID=661367 RepID=D3HJN3_LEGLN|nr:YaiI/YqxD family protein [Legionella longbeachae]VEE03162.1 Uncharacterized BCR, YaiI/YqxD family COG1671 [Legionella oakridgensis]HBD7398965.1 YaiI/YqxD family protein [Legionella pneumophila]ARB93938.1 YaiI/YqxD family protein [Legionella longbeachae]ARM32924.1 YaiI/YqxD family protein [Legionella longbeachae]EEZ94257.1 conserved hypothetical protein [Legionella longbeachae D-4968]
MKIWIDGDACPKAIKQILFRAAMKRHILVIIVANHLVTIPPSPFIKRVKVEAGFDGADKYIVAQVQSKDLVITADIILADHIITKQAFALNPRGTLYSTDNIKQVLTMRHLNESLRESGLIRGGLDTLSPKEIQHFSNHLDRMITQLHT